ncbi:zinc finger protein Helios isoform X3 [Drosophila sulfurigaster albostrigata]|uniref:zinc finger protein Helios isoform X3 n=2 Tax=Drosophila sulfurigaster albostrigata TaxID=89887 RepID=UPI002D21E03F|nr:zinc finger protein Helios isoform X3 [Drosophila sulfurigaster albostrigata]
MAMAEALSTAASSMELALKDPNVGVGGLIVDMTPTTAALLHHNALALRSLKEVASSASASASESEQPEPAEPTNLSTAGGGPHSPPMTFRCERCDNFETSSRATLLLHVVQCLAGQAAAAAAAVAAAGRLKSEDHDEPENMSVSHMDTTSNNNSSSNNNNNKGSNEGGSSSSASSSPAGNGSASSASGSATSANGSASRKVFECDVCNMKFSNGANMRRHKMRHTGVKPYECRVCQKRFFRKDHLAEHFTTHTKTLPYHCPICNRGFQRQIAMRAHFQNEHVGQHDLVKTCPLCSYRAGSMKSLRIHFFNRHGIDLDNPGPGGTSSLLLALESQASAAAAAAAASYVSQPLSQQQQQQQQQSPQQVVQQAPPPPPASHQSDSGESMRSLENATPPMHFLTPHVEISTLNENGNTELFNLICVLRESALQGNNNNNNNSHTSNNNNNIELDSKDKEHALLLQTPVVLGAPQELPMDCNTKATPISSSTASTASSLKSHHLHPHSHHHHHHHENHITPSISLIPIKQEPLLDEADKKESLNGNDSDSEHASNNNNNNSISNNNNNRITSLIKVSPLKSLLREDLKRRICAKANNRITRNATPLEHELQQNMMNGSNAGGTGTSPVGGNGASNASTSPNGANHHNGSASATPICNGTITSTGQETELLLNRKQILTCHFCGIEFPDETLYFLHKGCHCESNPWKCNICGEQLNNVYEFNSHLLSKSHQ